MNLGGRRAYRLPAVIAVPVALVAGGVVWTVAAGGPAPIRTETHRIQVVDGPKDDQHVTLDTTYYRPAGRGRAPAVLLAHGFGGSKDSVRSDAERLARDGFAVLTWSARGFGRSTGQIALDSPDYEVKDTRQLIDWLARRPDVRLDRPGDPRVGITGESYGGAIALLTAAYDPRVDAIAPRITWHDLSDALFPNAAVPAAGGSAQKADGVFKKLWAGVFFTGASDESGPTSPAGPAGSAGTRAGVPSPCGRFLPSLCDIYQKAAETGLPTQEAIATLRRSSPAAVEERIKVPALLVQGQADSLFPLDQADANARAISRNGAPVSVVWYQGGHDGGDPETGRVRDLVTGWFDRWLRRPAGTGPSDPSGSGQGGSGQAGRAAPGFTVTRAGGIDSTTQQVVVQAATTRSYPGLSAGPYEIPVSAPPGRPVQTIFNPAGGSPASVSALPGLGALGNLGDLGGGAVAGGLSLDMPGQAATFDSAPLSEPLRITGAPTVRIKVSVAGGSRDGAADGVTLFGKVYDVGPGGRAAPARRIAAPLRLTPDRAGTAEAQVTLPALDYQFDRGHRLRVVLSTTDMGFATSAQPASYQVSTSSALTVPTVPALRSPTPPPPWWTWALPAGAALTAAAIALTGRGRDRGLGLGRGRNGGGGAGHGTAPYDPALQDVPLEITGLTKSYGEGRLAVDDLSFRVEKGQVLGLLGPNGAGKTTTLRMLMGLIHPDSGEIRIFGHRVTPGTAALARLGSFVEGPGFLPHLSGRDNLDLYWRATGRPKSESHAEEALRIADLGGALDRPVRTYSQGMRQRLAIAQAMLGLPDLLVLDEPTNGLDPPQIREMREVLVRYAQGGRTVIVSSHMLAEVEQTCTHVVVMSQGRRVAAGPVPEIVGSERRLEDAFLAIIGEGGDA